MPSILSLTLCSLLAACGGGGGNAPEADSLTSDAPSSAEGSKNAATATSASSETSAQAPAAVTQMSDLVVDEGFPFTPSFPINISVNVADSQPQVDQVTMRLPSATASEQPDMNNCIVRSTLEQGRLVRDAQIRGDITRLYAVLWDFAAPNAPITRSFTASPTSNCVDLR